jgi:hypothetical protein
MVCFVTLWPVQELPTSPKCYLWVG